jgi:anaerobic C4-dicarboxylate transporter
MAHSYGAGTRLARHPGMVDFILRLTVAAVLILAAVNTIQGVALMVRLARHVARRQPQWGLNLWLPAFTSVSDIRSWLGTWHEVLRSGDPVFAKIRANARVVVGRHVYLALLSHAWAIAVTSLAPQLV